MRSCGIVPKLQQLIPMFLIIPQSIALAPLIIKENPTVPPTALCVVETGICNSVAINSHADVAARVPSSPTRNSALVYVAHVELPAK